jgi:hypothetical protein
LDETTALATLFAYKRRSTEDKDYLAMSDAVNSLLDLKQYGSIQAVAKATGYSGETLRALASLRKLPNEVQQLIQKKLLGYEAHKILLVNDTAKRIALGKVMVELNTDDARALVEYVRQNPSLSVEECKQKVLGSKTIKTNVFMVVAELQEEHYAKLKQVASAEGVPVDEIVRRIVKEWLEEKKDVL